VTTAVLLLVLVWQADPAAGIKALDEGRFADAEKIFEQAVAADDKDYSALFHLALARTFLNKDEDAMALFRRVLEMKPGLPEAELNLGLLLFRYRKFREALPYLDAVAVKRPNDSRAIFHAAESYRELGQHNEAIEAYRKTLAADSNLIAAQLGLARSLVGLGRVEEAAEWFTKAGAELELAQAYEDKGEFAKAIALYERSQTGEDALAVTTRLAGLYIRTGEIAKAEPLIAAALKQSPNDFDLRLTYGRMLRDKRQFEPAAMEFARAAQLKPESAEALNELAGMFISLNHDARAIAVLDRLKQLNAETPGHLFFRAVVLDRNRQVKPALAAYRAFLAASNGQYPDEEFKARQRARILEKEAQR
jgi:tetratricopeptide (TPR) repeat protein